MGGGASRGPAPSSASLSSAPTARLPTAGSQLGTAARYTRPLWLSLGMRDLRVPVTRPQLHATAGATPEFSEHNSSSDTVSHSHPVVTVVSEAPGHSPPGCLVSSSGNTGSLSAWQRGDRRTKPQTLQTEARVRRDGAALAARHVGAAGQAPGGGPPHRFQQGQWQLAAGLPRETHRGPEGTDGVAQGPDGAGGTKDSYSPFPERWLLWGRPPARPRAVGHPRRACHIEG